MISLISTLRIHCAEVGDGFGSRPFSVLQAVTQSVQPLAHLVVSISMPQRTLGLAPAVGGAGGLRDLDQPDARREHHAGQAGGGDAEEAARGSFRCPPAAPTAAPALPVWHSKQSIFTAA